MVSVSTEHSATQISATQEETDTMLNYTDTEVMSALYSVDGGAPATGAQIMRDNEDKETTREALIMAYDAGVFDGFNSATIKRVKTALKTATKRATKATKRATKATKRPSALVVTYPSFYLVFTALSGSSNRKTGDMVQTYLLDRETLTSEPKVFGAKCVECPMVNKCYVSRDKMSVRKALARLLGEERTSYAHATLDQVLPLLSGRKVRLGTYGDPSALPLDDLKAIVSACEGHTGYTHFWASIDTEYSAHLMASVEDATGELLAQGLGYRTFRVITKEDTERSVSSVAVECLNTSSGLTCAECLLCSGTEGKGRKVSIWIDEH